MDALLDKITDHQFREWRAFFGLEPWGAEAEWCRTGVVASTVFNMSPNRKPRSKPMTPGDFMPGFEFAESAKSAKPSKVLRLAVAAAFGGEGKKPS